MIVLDNKPSESLFTKNSPPSRTVSKKHTSKAFSSAQRCPGLVCCGPFGAKLRKRCLHKTVHGRTQCSRFSANPDVPGHLGSPQCEFFWGLAEARPQPPKRDASVSRHLTAGGCTPADICENDGQSTVHFGVVRREYKHDAQASVCGRKRLTRLRFVLVWPTEVARRQIHKPRDQ